MLEQFPVVYGRHSHVKLCGYFITFLIQNFKTLVVIDEVHKFKNPKSSLTCYARLVLKGREALWALTATPLNKDLADCYNIINFVKPWFFGTFEQFKKDYCKIEAVVIGKFPDGTLKKKDSIVGVVNNTILQQKLSQIVITGTNTVEVNWHYYKYIMSKEEERIYRKLARGIFASKYNLLEDKEAWFKQVIMGEEEKTYVVREHSRHSSRFIYLQYAADGIIQENGVIGESYGTKCLEILKILRGILS